MESGEETTEPLTYAVVLPTKDRPVPARSAVEQMLRQTRPPAQVIVVDASTSPLDLDPSMFEDARSAGIELTVEHRPPSTSAQRNFGVGLVRAPIVIFLDDDVIVPPDYAAALLERWEREGLEAFGGIVGSPINPSSNVEGPLSKILRQALMLHYQDRVRPGTTIRRSGKLRYVHHPKEEVRIPAVATMAVAYRTDLSRKHRFDEHFPGYALGEDLDMSLRVSAEAPILQLPKPEFVHDEQPGERDSPNSWYYRGRRETYFRLRHLDRSPLSVGAFALSITAEASAAAIASVRQRNPNPARLFLGGFAETLNDLRVQRRPPELSLKPRSVYVASRALQRVRAWRVGRSDAMSWEGVRIFGYHRISDDDDIFAVRPSDFRAHLELMRKHDLEPIRLDRAIDLLSKPVSGRYACVTFDDGYADNLENALPHLTELDFPATVFLPSAIIDGRATYNWYKGDAPRAMNWDEVDELIAGGLVDVQAHSQTHPALPRLDDDRAKEEIAGSKREIEEHVGYPLTSFCYPAGFYSERDARLVRESGFRAGVTTKRGFNPGGEPLETLNRTMVYWQDTAREIEARISGRFDRPLLPGGRRARGRAGASS